RCLHVLPRPADRATVDRPPQARAPCSAASSCTLPRVSFADPRASAVLKRPRIRVVSLWLTTRMVSHSQPSYCPTSRGSGPTEQRGERLRRCNRPNHLPNAVQRRGAGTLVTCLRTFTQVKLPISYWLWQRSAWSGIDGIVQAAPAEVAEKSRRARR